MRDGPQREFQYQPTYCALQGKNVWAILTQQPDGSWRTVNCLDKDESCFSVDCAFTTDQGEWPYSSVTGPLHQQNCSPCGRHPVFHRRAPWLREKI